MRCGLCAWWERGLSREEWWSVSGFALLASSQVSLPVSQRLSKTWASWVRDRDVITHGTADVNKYLWRKQMVARAPVLSYIPRKWQSPRSFGGTRAPWCHLKWHWRQDQFGNTWQSWRCTCPVTQKFHLQAFITLWCMKKMKVWVQCTGVSGRATGQGDWAQGPGCLWLFPSAHL